MNALSGKSGLNGPSAGNVPFVLSARALKQARISSKAKVEAGAGGVGATAVAAAKMKADAVSTQDAKQPWIRRGLNPSPRAVRS